MRSSMNLAAMVTVTMQILNNHLCTISSLSIP